MKCFSQFDECCYIAASHVHKTCDMINVTPSWKEKNEKLYDYLEKCELLALELQKVQPASQHHVKYVVSMIWRENHQVADLL